MMTNNNYHFVTHWRIQSTLKEVTDVLRDATDLVRWWPSVYLDVRVLEEGEPSGLGKVVKLYTKGWLPYTLRWSFRVTEVRENGFTLVASGDFDGRGIWTFTQDGEWVDVVYDWKISAEKPLLRNFSWIMKPIFSANHHWAMSKGEESLKLELVRRHARTVEERVRIPDPPQATINSLVAVLSGVTVFIALMSACGYVLVRAFKNCIIHCGDDNVQYSEFQ